jgi:large subunit ribosomal protein L4
VQRTPKKMKAAALRGALSDRARHGRVQVVSGFVDGSEPRTKDALAVLGSATGAGRGTAVLVVARRDDELTWKSLRNAVGVRVLADTQLNTYDVLAADHVVFTAEALRAFVGRGTAGNEEAAQ